MISWGLKQFLNDKHRKCNFLPSQNIKLVHSKLDTWKAICVTQALNTSLYLQFALKDLNSHVTTDYLTQGVLSTTTLLGKWLLRIHCNNSPGPPNHHKKTTGQPLIHLFSWFTAKNDNKNWLQIRSLFLMDSVPAAMAMCGIRKVKVPNLTSNDVLEDLWFTKQRKQQSSDLEDSSSAKTTQALRLTTSLF